MIYSLELSLKLKFVSDSKLLQRIDGTEITLSPHSNYIYCKVNCGIADLPGKVISNMSERF